MASILLVGVDPTLATSLEALLRDHRVVAYEGVVPPDLVIVDVGRLDPAEVADTYPDVLLLGFTSGGDTAGLRLAQTAGFDAVVVRSELLERAEGLIRELLAPVE
jgi:hypothetical protein